MDISHSDLNVDLGAGRLPWADNVFDLVVSQHVIEHLELRDELLPLFEELNRVVKPGGEVWLSCPDIEKLCRSYLDHNMKDLVADREERSRILWSEPWTLDKEMKLEGVPTSQLMNAIFYQGNEHRNLFDLELLSWALKRSGFRNVTRTDEESLLAALPEFPRRSDDRLSIYVRAIAS